MDNSAPWLIRVPGENIVLHENNLLKTVIDVLGEFFVDDIQVVTPEGLVLPPEWIQSVHELARSMASQLRHRAILEL